MGPPFREGSADKHSISLPLIIVITTIIDDIRGNRNLPVSAFASRIGHRKEIFFVGEQ
jgi:hypothetical protein